MMNFGINKYINILELAPLFQNKRDLTFYLDGQPIPITKCYTYLGIPFDKSLSLNPIINLLDTKVTKALFSVSKYLSNSKIPITFKKIIINSFVLIKFSYFAPLLGSNKARTNNTHKLINKGLRWFAGLQKPNLLLMYILFKRFKSMIFIG